MCVDGEFIQEKNKRGIQGERGGEKEKAEAPGASASHRNA
jgi:hypothetical protein